MHLWSTLIGNPSSRCKSIYLISQTNSIDNRPRTSNHTCLQAGSLPEWFFLMHQWNCIILWEEQQTSDKRIQSIIRSVALCMLNSSKGKRIQASLERHAFSTSLVTAGKIWIALALLCMALLLQKLYSCGVSMKQSHPVAFDREKKIGRLNKKHLCLLVQSQRHLQWVGLNHSYLEADLWEIWWRDYKSKLASSCLSC